MLFLISDIFLLNAAKLFADTLDGAINFIAFSFKRFRSFYQEDWESCHSVWLISQFEESSKTYNCAKSEPHKWLTILRGIKYLVLPVNLRGDTNCSRDPFAWGLYNFIQVNLVLCGFRHGWLMNILKVNNLFICIMWFIFSVISMVLDCFDHLLGRLFDCTLVLDWVVVVECVLNHVAIKCTFYLFVDMSILIFRHNKTNNEHHGQAHEWCHSLLHSIFTMFHELFDEAFLRSFESMFWCVVPILLLFIFLLSSDRSRFWSLSIISFVHVLVLPVNDFDINILLL